MSKTKYKFKSPLTALSSTRTQCVYLATCSYKVLFVPILSALQFAAAACRWDKEPTFLRRGWGWGSLGSVQPLAVLTKLSVTVWGSCLRALT